MIDGRSWEAIFQIHSLCEQFKAEDDLMLSLLVIFLSIVERDSTVIVLEGVFDWFRGDV